MFTLANITQVRSWHDGGLFMGMHWLWWFAWALTLFAIVWAFVRFYGDRTETRRSRDSEEAAEEVLRRRFADGDIDDEEFARRLRALRETHTGV